MGVPKTNRLHLVGWLFDFRPESPGRKKTQLKFKFSNVNDKTFSTINNRQSVRATAPAPAPAPAPPPSWPIPGPTLCCAWKVRDRKFCLYACRTIYLTLWQPPSRRRQKHALKLIAKTVWSVWMEREWLAGGRWGGKGADTEGAALPITMSASCHLNNIKLIAENLPSSSIEWPRHGRSLAHFPMGARWGGGGAVIAIATVVCFSTICQLFIT